MAARSDSAPGRNLRYAAAWLTTAAILGIYVTLPNGDEPPLDKPTAEQKTDEDPGKLDIVDVSPPSAEPGRAVIVAYVGADDPAGVRAFVGKEELEVLSRREGSLVVKLPSTLEPGRVKIRVASGQERSKPYDLRAEPSNWQKPFRNLVGGLALLVLGIGMFARGARHTAGLSSARLLTRVASRTPAAAAVGLATGALVQSTTAAAALVSGLVGSSLLGVVPAAAVFLGAQVGAATAPLVIGILDSREGLVVVAIGVLWASLAVDRRSTAIGRLVLGAGLIAFGVQTLRPGFELVTSDPALLSLLSGLDARGPAGIALCGLVGAALVALLQGPALALLLVLVLAETTGRWDLRTALAVLSGAGFGAALGALVTTPSGLRGRHLAIVHLVLGALSTVLALASLDVWIALADGIVSGAPDEIRYGKRVILPNMGRHLGVAFALSQLGVLVLLQAFVPAVSRIVEKRFLAEEAPSLVKVGDPVGVVRSGLIQALVVQERALARIHDLLLEASREAGREAEHLLTDVRAATEELVAGPLQVLPRNFEGGSLGGASLACLELGRSLEGLLRQADNFVDRRVAALGATGTVLSSDDSALLTEMHERLTEGITQLRRALEEGEGVDIDAAQAREIRLNGLAVRARNKLMSGQAPLTSIRDQVGLQAVMSAYEAVGNELYRLSEALADEYAQAASMAVS